MKPDIICFALDDWTPIWRRRHHLMSHFAKERNVIYISLPISIWQLLNIKLWFTKSGRISLNRIFKPITQPLPNLTVITIKRFLPGRFEGVRLIKNINEYLIKVQLRNINSKRVRTKPILWVQNVEAAMYIDLFDKSLLIYDNTEDWLEFFSPHRTSFKKSVALWDKILLTKSDLVFVVSKDLFYKKKVYNPATYLIPNGVDFKHFNKADLKETPIHPAIKNLDCPVLGYVGWLSSRINFQLVERLALERPDWNVVLIGPVENSNLVKNLAKLRNVYLFGSIPYQELPEFIKKFDVCMIPHMVNKLTASMNPLKLFEFLATGKPIVSTNIGGVDEFLDIIFVADSEEDFIDKLQKALYEDSIKNKDMRLKRAKLYTWDQRVREINTLMEGKIIEKQNASA